jgi:hypothetical protein
MKGFNGQTELLDILYIVGWPMRQKGKHTCSKATISNTHVKKFVKVFKKVN